MAYQIEETFRVDAPPDRVWAFLIDPERVVRCLPGAEIVEIVDAQQLRGRIQVRVGPVSTAYQGRATFVEIDHDTRRVRVEARGDEESGPGSASMTMVSSVTASDGATEVSVSAEVEVAGKIVQFGRGMIDTVSRQLFRQFTEFTRARLESEGGEKSIGDEGPPGNEDTRGAEGSIGDENSTDGRSTEVRLIPLLFSSLVDKLRDLLRRSR